MGSLGPLGALGWEAVSWLFVDEADEDGVAEARLTRQLGIFDPDNESGTQPFDIPWGFGQEVWGRRSTQGLEFGSELVHGFVVEAASCIAKPNELFAVIGAQDEATSPASSRVRERCR